MLSKRTLLLLVALWMCRAPAHAANDLLVGLQGAKVVPPASHSGGNPVYWQPTGGQYVIPRYANGATHPAGALIGLGPMSVVQGTVYGPSDGSNPNEIVVTEDYTSGTMNMWANGNLATAAVLQPTIRNLTIVGKDDQANNYGSGGVVNDNPGLWNPVSWGFNYRETGAYVQASAPVLENLQFSHIAGTCLVVTRGGGWLNGAVTPFDNEKFRVADCFFSRAYSGAEIATVDGVCGRMAGFGLRDFGLKVTGGAIQFEGAQHWWGVGAASGGGAPAPCVWLTNTAGECWGGPWYVETSDIGMYVQSSGNRFSEIYSKNCPHGSLVVTGMRNSFEDCHIDGNISWTGTAVGGSSSTIQFPVNNADGDDRPNGQIVCITGGPGAGQARVIVDYVASTDTATVSPNWSTAPTSSSTYQGYVTQAIYSGTAQGGTASTIQLAAATDLPDDSLIGQYVWIKSGTGAGQARQITDYVASTDTITVSSNWTTTPNSTSVYDVLFEAPTVAFWDQYTTLSNSHLTIEGRPAGAPEAVGIRVYTGTGLKLDDVNFLGGGSGAKGIGIQVRGNVSGPSTLNYSTIKAHVQWLGGGIGVDLLDGTLDRIGAGNTIWITHSPDMTATQALQLHGNWSTTDDGQGETNDVRINGIRYYRSGPT